MGGIVDFFKAVAGICETKPLDKALWRVEGDQAVVLLASASGYLPQGGAVRLEGPEVGQPVLVMRATDGTYRAYVNKCTHMGRRMDPAKDGQILRCCSVNHSTFDLEGVKRSGPAKGGLTVLPVQHESGELRITLPKE
jgi:cytochrome b6-f complex iron-sulfur subunit